MALLKVTGNGTTEVATEATVVVVVVRVVVDVVVVDVAG